MPSKSKINLLPKDKFEYSAAGKFIKWSVSVGRWIVVLTEFIVICAFLSRFYFDTQLANLFDDIKQKKSIVAAATGFEENFRQIQSKTKLIRNLLDQETSPSSLIAEISRLLPQDVTLTALNMEDQQLAISGYAFSESSVKLFLSGLVKNPRVEGVNLDEISSLKEGIGVNFIISATIKKISSKPTQTK